MAQSEAEKKLKKDDKKKELQELNELFKPVVAAQKISKGKIKCHKCSFNKCSSCCKLGLCGAGVTPLALSEDLVSVPSTLGTSGTHACRQPALTQFL